jgi:hypothetical protein
MSSDIEVWEPTHGSADALVRRQWRRNRNAAYRIAYKEQTGKAHAASKKGEPKKDLNELLEQTEPPYGMTWSDFGNLWDLHPEHPFTPVLRKMSVDDQWKKKLEDREAEAAASE